MVIIQNDPEVGIFIKVKVHYLMLLVSFCCWNELP